jgi:hypothetical protein
MLDGYITRLTDRRVLGASATSFPAITDPDDLPIDLTTATGGWVDTGLFYLFLDPAAAVDVSAAYVIGYEPKRAKMRRLFDIDDVSLLTAVGWERPVLYCAGITKLGLVATLSSAVAIVVGAEPAEVR